ncbi:MAG: type I methionyl aminopeptidase [Chitinophagales bacterium]|nr:type I methionyl aminopeptidase [Chitinophagales bacterium]MDW8427542.1 type I methionyl aminopeptidase [Chitinophagales bacterium]
MIYYKTADEIEAIRKACHLVSRTLGAVAQHIRPGVRTRDLDRVAYAFIHDLGGKPAFLGYKGFPASICTSVNDAVVHGIPGDYELKEGDIVSVDCGVVYEGFYGDSAYTFAVGQIDEEKSQLLRVTYQALLRGIEQARPGKRIGDISHAIQRYVEQRGFSVVRELVGHGIGRSLHEDPEVPNYGKRGNGLRLLKGLVIAIEPMINAGRREVYTDRDQWTVRTRDGKPSAHFEHTIAIADQGPEVLTTFEFIECTSALSVV